MAKAKELMLGVGERERRTGNGARTTTVSNVEIIGKGEKKSENVAAISRRKRTWVVERL